jgi:hypothetical protein
VTPPTIICFDAESNGLHGPAFAVGAVVLDGAGAELETFYARSPIVGDVDPWVRDNVLPVLADAPITHSTPREMRDAFWAWLAQRKATGMVVVDCGWPVEAGLLCACVADDPSRAFCGPYPLHEVASLMVAAGLDPMDDYSGIVLPPEAAARHRPHHPTDDARVSALCARYAMLARDRASAAAELTEATLWGDLAAARADLKAIADGRNEPPTDAEVDAHDGPWFLYDGTDACVLRDSRAAKAWAHTQRRHPENYTDWRWRAATHDGKITHWPKG